MVSVSSGSNVSQVFHLADFVLYLEKFPCLAGKPVIGAGCFSYVFASDSEDTVLKLTCDPVFSEFIRLKGGAAGLPQLVLDHGSIESSEFGMVSLFELERLSPLDRWDHERMLLEREALSKMVSFKVAMSEMVNGFMPTQVAHAYALREIASTMMFSTTIRAALSNIADYMEHTKLDVLLDLGNPNNYMTNGRELVITDPLMLVT